MGGRRSDEHHGIRKQLLFLLYLYTIPQPWNGIDIGSFAIAGVDDIGCLLGISGTTTKHLPASQQTKYKTASINTRSTTRGASARSWSPRPSTTPKVWKISRSPPRPNTLSITALRLSGTRLSGLPDRPKDHRRGNTRLYLRRRRSRRRAYRAAERLYFLRQNPQYALRRNHQRNDGIQAGENYAARRASGIYLRHPARYRRFRTYLGNAGKEDDGKDITSPSPIPLHSNTTVSRRNSGSRSSHPTAISTPSRPEHGTCTRCPHCLSMTTASSATRRK